ARFEIHSAPAAAKAPAAWTQHSAGELAVAAALPECPALDRFRALCGETLQVDELYRELDAVGLRYSGAFHCLRSLHVSPGRAVAYVKAETRDAAALLVAPWLLDGCFQAIAAASRDRGARSLHVPLRIGRLVLDAAARGDGVWCCVEMRAAARRIAADLYLY